MQTKAQGWKSFRFWGAAVLFGSLVYAAAPPGGGHAAPAPAAPAFHAAPPPMHTAPAPGYRAPGPVYRPPANAGSHFYNPGPTSHQDWHAGWNTGMRGAASRYPARPIRPTWGDGERRGYRDGRSVFVVPFYTGVPYGVPYGDAGSYGYYDDPSAIATPDPAAGAYTPYPPAAPYPPGAYPPDYAPYPDGSDPGVVPPGTPPYGDPNAPDPDNTGVAPPRAPARPQQASPNQPATAQPAAPEPPITIVLQNGQRLIIQNYAIVDSMLWDFSQPLTRKIPLSSIDLNASMAATNATGAEFPQLTPTR